MLYLLITMISPYRLAVTSHLIRLNLKILDFLPQVFYLTALTSKRHFTKVIMSVEVTYSNMHLMYLLKEKRLVFFMALKQMEYTKLTMLFLEVV